MRVIRTYYARMLRVNDEYKYASGSVRLCIKLYIEIRLDLMEQVKQKLQPFKL